MQKIINYKAGNAASVAHAAAHIGRKTEFIRSPEDFNGASHIILPGVGSAKATMESLREMNLLHTLEETVLVQKKPFLGICVGLQVLFEHSEEEDTTCLGWLKGNIVRFDSSAVRVPQMGWNKTTFVKEGLQTVPADYFYFVNSYHAVLRDTGDLWAAAEYGGKFTAAVRRGNIFATQFHVEKSGKAGLALLDAFFREGGELC